MFEMMIGYPPFYSDDPLTTCRKIVNWRMFLKFPDEIRVRVFRGLSGGQHVLHWDPSTPAGEPMCVMW